jgi:misacylated tRNA(Ala) deacylase
MTEHLYLRDSYLQEFDAAVDAVREHAVALDRTAFYPGGGGQPGDAGALEWNGTSVRVAELQRDGDLLWHALEGAPPDAGAAVRGRIDWARRYAIMRHHSALHVLVGIVYRRFGAKVTGGAIYPDRARMDFSLENLDKELVASIEAQTNAVIAEDRPIRVRFIPREEYERADLTRLANVSLPPAVREVRIVEIEDFDAQADGGTHVARTGEIGRLEITKTENKGKANRRLEIALHDGGTAG